MISRFRTLGWCTFAFAICLAVAALWDRSSDDEVSAMAPGLKLDQQDSSGEETSVALQGKIEAPAERESVVAPPTTASEITRKQRDWKNPRAGCIGGTVTLLDGDPLPNVEVQVKQVSQAESWNAVSENTTTNDAGLFKFTDLPEGAYELTVSSPWPLPIQDPRTVEPGNSPIVLAVDAIVVRAQITDTFDDVSLIDRILCTRTDSQSPPDDLLDTYGKATSLNMEDGEARAAFIDRLMADLDEAIELEKVNPGAPRPARRPMPGQWIQHADFVLPASSCLSFSFKSVTDALFSSPFTEKAVPFLGTVPAGQPSGSQVLELSQDSADFGTLVIRLEQPGLRKGAILRVNQVKHNGVIIFLVNDRSYCRKPGVLGLPLYALTPGLYELQVSLSGGDSVVLDQSEIQAYVSGGMTTEHRLKASASARLTITAEATGPYPQGSFADLKVQKPGSLTWQSLPLHTRDNRNGRHLTFRKSAVLVGGPAGVSDPTESGEYRLRLTLPGHIPLEQTIEVRAGEANEFTLELQAE